MFRRIIPRKAFTTTYTSWNSVRRGSNDAVLDMLRLGQEAEKSRPNKNAYRLRAFKRAITTIEEMSKPIHSIDDVVDVEGIGTGIRRRIQTFLCTGDPEASIFQDPQKQSLRDALMNLPFIGPTTATQLINAGCSSIHDIQRPKMLALLKPKQKVGIKYHRQLSLPVSLIEAEKVKDFIQESIIDYQVVLCGGHRRAHPTPDSIILLLLASHVYVPIPEEMGPPDPNKSKLGRGPTYFRPKHGYTKKEEQTRSPLLRHIIPRLQDRALIAEAIKDHMSKWTGIIRVPEHEDRDMGISTLKTRKKAIEEVKGRFVRLEINLAPQKSFGAATMALTGDVEFNRTIQRQAAKMGMLLNEFGLWKWMAHRTSDESNGLGIERGSWRLISSDSEEGIFAELGMEYVPHERRGYQYLV